METEEQSYKKKQLKHDDVHETKELNVQILKTV